MTPRRLTGFPDATPVTHARAKLLTAVDVCPEESHPRCKRVAALADALIEAVREEERQRRRLEEAGIPPEHL